MEATLEVRLLVVLEAEAALVEVSEAEVLEAEELLVDGNPFIHYVIASRFYDAAKALSISLFLRSFIASISPLP